MWLICAADLLLTKLILYQAASATSQNHRNHIFIQRKELFNISHLLNKQKSLVWILTAGQSEDPGEHLRNGCARAFYKWFKGNWHPDVGLKYQFILFLLLSSSPGSSELNEQRSRALQVDLIDRVVFVWILVVPTTSSADSLPLAVNLRTEAETQTWIFKIKVHTHTHTKTNV